MKVPGDALLEFRIPAGSAGDVRLEMISRFLPRGLAGIGYGYGMLPVHDWLFKGILAQVARQFGSFRSGIPGTFPVEIGLECKL
jgi:hypothetical protein